MVRDEEPTSGLRVRLHLGQHEDSENVLNLFDLWKNGQIDGVLGEAEEYISFYFTRIKAPQR